jgi:AraC family transcriptional regulator
VADAHVRPAEEHKRLIGLQRGSPSVHGSRMDRESIPRVAARLITGSSGRIEIAPAMEHRIRVLSGPPVRGSCGSAAFRYIRGDIDIVPIGSGDSWYERDRSRVLQIELSGELMDRVAEELGASAGRRHLEARHQLRDSKIEHIAWAFEAELLAGSPSGSIYLDGLGTALAAHLLGRSDSLDRQRGGFSQAQLSRVLDLIEQRIDQPLTLRRLSEAAEVSTSHFSSLFKRSMGVSAHTYVVRRRVERAEELLRSSELPVTQIALEVGFSHQTHLARWMRRLKGLTPREARIRPPSLG